MGAPQGEIFCGALEPQQAELTLLAEFGVISASPDCPVIILTYEHKSLECSVSQEAPLIKCDGLIEGMAIRKTVHWGGRGYGYGCD